MSVREWALVGFTLAMQTSVGVLLVVTLLHPLVGRGTAHAPLRTFDVPLLVAAAGAALALVASLAHLGQPLHAWLAIANLRTSWLSREIALALMFTGAVVCFAALARTPAGWGTLRTGVSVLAIALGIAALYAMSRLYMVPAQPAWNRIATPLAFFATMLVLGSLVVLAGSPALAAGPALKGGTSLLPLRVLVLLAIGCLVLQLFLLPAQLGAVAAEPAAAVSAASAGHLATWLAAARALLALAAAVLLATAVRPGAASLPTGLSSAALVLACLSEICGRVLFYASSVRL